MSVFTTLTLPPPARRARRLTACAPAATRTPPPSGFRPASPVINNANLLGSAINPVTYEEDSASRASTQFTPDWNLLITQSYQDMDSRGVFYQQPNASDGAPLQPLEVTLFNPSYDRDKFEHFLAWTVNGKFGNLKAVYTGGYLVRNVEQVGDYTNYARDVFADCYQCYGPPGAGTFVKDPSLTSTCFSPSASWHETEHNVHQQHEFRLSTPDEWRLRADRWERSGRTTCCTTKTGWLYKTMPPCTAATRRPAHPATAIPAACRTVGTFPNTTVQNPGVQSDNTSFYQGPAARRPSRRPSSPPSTST